MSVMNEAVLSELQARNIVRAKEICKKMGDKWVLHPRHSVTRKPHVPSVLDLPRRLLVSSNV